MQILIRNRHVDPLKKQTLTVPMGSLYAYLLKQLVQLLWSWIKAAISAIWAWWILPIVISIIGFGLTKQFRLGIELAIDAAYLIAAIILGIRLVIQWRGQEESGTD